MKEQNSILNEKSNKAQDLEQLNLIKKTELLELEKTRVQGRITYFEEPEQMHVMDSELAHYDEQIDQLTKEFKVIKDSVKSNENALLKLETSRDKSKFVKMDYNELSKEYSKYMSQHDLNQKTLVKYIDKNKEMNDQIEELRDILYELGDNGNNSNAKNRYDEYLKLEKEKEVINKKQVSDNKKFEREYYSKLKIKKGAVESVESRYFQILQIEAKLSNMYDNYYQVIKDLFKIEISPSYLVKECGVTIDEAALHDKAFTITNTLHLIDKNQLNDILMPEMNNNISKERGGSMDRYNNKYKKNKNLNNLSMIENYYDNNNDIFGNVLTDSLSPDKKIKFEDRERSRVSNYKESLNTVEFDDKDNLKSKETTDTNSNKNNSPGQNFNQISSKKSTTTTKREFPLILKTNSTDNNILRNSEKQDESILKDQNNLLTTNLVENSKDNYNDNNTKLPQNNLSPNTHNENDDDLDNLFD
eukprot:Mrub_02619.p1 GENE.Mrub_02619~~Mrub_02619.p1  ORF type:complete len:546 (+),score=139.23 Mrub_02619:217-1638(+)